ncbi:hypothetical protein GDO81_028912, partial [Engystomops pustulosus]
RSESYVPEAQSGGHRLTYPQRMDENRGHLTNRILNLTLEIIFILTGEDYAVVKKKSGKYVMPNSCFSESERWSKTRVKSNNEWRILELTNKILELLTGE